MLKYEKFGIIAKVGTGVTIFAVAFFAAFLSSSHFMPVKESNAETNGAYYANITSSGSIDINIDATPDGIGKVGKDTLSIDTNATAGYKLYLSTASGAPNNGLYLESDPTKAITATTGTLSEPSKLATNTWGFAPSRANSSATPTTYTDADADAVTGSAVFAGVPEYGSENIIYTNTSPSTAGTNSVDVYFGVNASTALESGEYSNTVVYTAIVDAVNPSSEEITLSPTSQEGLSAGTPITISTGLYPSSSTSDFGNITVTIGGSNCTSVTPSVDATNGNLIITCDSPAATDYGSADVIVTIEKYNKIYTLADGYRYTNPTPAFYTITTMQEMTPDVCNSVHTPNNGTGSNITLVDNVNDYLNTYNVTTDGTRYVPQRTLLDARDGNSYVVRKLADGKCWMTQDFDLQLSSSKTLTPDDTDVSSNWTPNNSGCVTGEGTVTSTASAPACYDFGEQYMIVRNYDDGATIETSGEKTQHMGSLYNYYAATAGTGILAGSGTATSSICPKGWGLPSASDQENLYFTMYSIHYKEYYVTPTDAEIATLKADAKRALAAPLSIVLIGRFYNGSQAYHYPYVGEFFNKTVVVEDSSAQAGIFTFHNMMNINYLTMISSSYTGFTNGRGMRCIAK